MLNVYNHIAALTRMNLSYSFTAMNATTNDLLGEVGIRRADTNAASAVLYDMAEADLTALTAGITEANNAVSMNQTADDALATIHGKLDDMRALAEDVEYGDLTEEEIATKADEYEALAAEVETLLEDTSYDGRTLLSGRNPVVRFNLENVLEMDLTSMPEGGTFDVSRAMIDVTGAREQLEAENNRLADAITAMDAQQDELLSFESQLTTAQEALSTLQSVMQQMFTEPFGASATQSNVTNLSAMRLLT